MSRRSRDPFYVSESYAKAASGVTETEQIRSGVGVVEAIVYPIHTRPGGVGCVFIGSETKFTLPDNKIAELSVLADCIFNKLSESQFREKTEPKSAINDRQVEIIRLTAQGGSPEIIMDKLNIAAVAMKRDTQDICFNLGVRDLQTAAVRALRLGLIPK